MCITKENEKSVDLNRFKYNNSLNTAVPQKQRHNQLVALDQINNVEDIQSGNKNNILSVTANPSFKNRSFLSYLKPQKTMRLEFDQSQPTTEFNKETQNKAIELINSCKVYNKDVNDSYKKQIDEVYNK